MTEKAFRLSLPIRGLICFWDSKTDSSHRSWDIPYREARVWQECITQFDGIHCTHHALC